MLDVQIINIQNDDNMKTDYFYVGQDIQVQIDHEDKEWYDEYGKLKLEYIFDELGNGSLIEMNEINNEVDCGYWEEDGKVFRWYYSDMRNLKEKGFSKMYFIGTFKDIIDTALDSHLEFLKWRYSVETIEEALKIINK